MCGCTSYDDAARALDAGADAVGVIFAQSPRRVSVATAAAIARAFDPFAVVVGLFADQPIAEVHEVLAEIPSLRLQFSGSESPAECESFDRGRYLKAFHLGAGAPDDVLAEVQKHPHALPLFDTYDPARRGGTGTPFDWSVLVSASLERPFAVAGGLTPENVGDCIRLLRPQAVDVRSGVETDGRKDPHKMRAFVRAVRQADAQT